MHNCRIDKALHDRGLYKTHSRHRIFELFHDDRPWSARQLEKKLHDVARATIFRTLRLLLKEKAIKKIEGDDNHAYFERTGQPHHDHLTCDSCAAVECLPCPVPELKKKHILNVSGTCRTCRA